MTNPVPKGNGTMTYWTIHVPRESGGWTKAEGAWYSVEDTTYAMIDAVRKYPLARAVRHESGMMPMVGMPATMTTAITRFRKGTLVPGIESRDGPLTPKGIAARKREKEGATS